MRILRRFVSLAAVVVIAAIAVVGVPSAAVAAPPWTPPVDVSAAGGDAFAPQIVVTGTNALSAIWYRSNGTNDIVQSSLSTNNGATWSAPVNVSVAGGNAVLPQLVVTGANALSAIWYRYDGTNTIVQSSLSTDNGASWSAPVDVSVAGGDASGAQLVVTGTNALSAIWSRYNGTNYIVQSSSSADNGATWSAPVDVSVALGDALAPQLVVTGANALSAIWFRSNGTNNIVQTSALVAPVVTPPELAATGTNGASAATGIFTVAGLTLLGTVLLLTSRRRTARTARTSGFSGKALSSK